CVHCGLCLPTCPTYVVLGVEMDNPRGRIRLMKTAHEGGVSVGSEFDEHIYKCLDCRACETACPSGVQFGKIVEAARAQVEAQRPRPPLQRAVRALFFDVLLPRPRLLALAARVSVLGARVGGPILSALARKNIDRLERVPDVDAIIVNAAGCGANLKEYGWLLKDDPQYAERAERFAARVKDATEFLGDRGLAATPGGLRLRVTYDDPCHLLHGQKIREQPRALLAAIPELEVVPLEEADMCCGSAGIYNVTHDEIARALLQRKVERIARTHASVVVTANPGCAMQIEAGLRRAGLDIRVAHVVEVLDAAYGGTATVLPA